MRDVPTKHHYVPQAYLRRFSYDKKQQHVFVIRKKNSTSQTQITSANIKDICEENHFYSVCDEKGQKYTKIEEQYSKIENQSANKIFHQIPKDLLYPYNTNGIILDAPQKELFVEAVILQIVRNKSIREYGLKMANDSFGEALSEMKVKYSDKKERSQYLRLLKQQRRMLVNNTLVEGPMLFFQNGGQQAIEIRNNIRARNCIVFMNNTGIDLVTSDEPILIGNKFGVVSNILSYPLDELDSQIIYPLDSRHLAGFYTQEECDNLYCDKGIIAILLPKDADFIKNVNLAHYRNCINYVIAEKKETLQQILEMIEDNSS